MDHTMQKSGKSLPTLGYPMRRWLCVLMISIFSSFLIEDLAKAASFEERIAAGESPWRVLRDRELHYVEIEELELILANGFDVNARTSHPGATSGNTFLIQAMRQRSYRGLHDDRRRDHLLQVGRWFIDNGADTELRGLYSQTALLVASEKCDIEAVNMLVANGADVNVRETDPRKHRRTPLIYAALCEHIGMVQHLVENGADINAKDSNKSSALSISKVKYLKHLEVLKLLTEAETDD